MKKEKLILFTLFIFLIFVFMISFSIGRYPVSITDIFKIVSNKLIGSNYKYESSIETVLINIRLPRIISSVAIGASLSVAGAVYQAIFHNPMVSPDILAVSQGSAFGAAISILMGFSYSMISINSFVLGILAVLITVLISMLFNGDTRLGLILSGIMVSSIFSSTISLVKLVADPENELPAITYWLMGSLNSIKMKDLVFALPIMIIGILIIKGFSWHLNIFTLGSSEMIVGINKKLLLTIFIGSATLITSVCISISGIIGWIGLVIPHFVRMLLGENYKYLIPGCVLMGAGFLLIVDNISRVIYTSEIPLGILTSFVGAPLFLYLMIRSGKND